MKAAVRNRYGPPEVLHIEQVERPVPKDDDVLVRIRATTVTRTDLHMCAAKPFIWRFMLGLRRPKAKVLGIEFAGEVETVGSAVTKFRVGDRVFGLRNGAHAEYVCVGEERLLAHIPDHVTFQEAAGVCDGFYQAFGHLKKAGVSQGTRLAVYGASGSCGTAAVQLGKHHFGAHVTGVCNTKNVELVRSLGADEVIDYLNEDFTKRRQKYDVVLDAVGKHSYFRSRRALAPQGIFVATDRLYNFPLAFLTRIAKKKVVFNVERPIKQDILLLKELLEARKYRPVIDRTYPLEDVVRATKYVDTFQKVGNVVLTIDAYSSAKDTASSSASSRPSA